MVWLILIWHMLAVRLGPTMLAGAKGNDTCSLCQAGSYGTGSGQSGPRICITHTWMSLVEFRYDLRRMLFLQHRGEVHGFELSRAFFEILCVDVCLQPNTVSRQADRYKWVGGCVGGWTVCTHGLAALGRGLVVQCVCSRDVLQRSGCFAAVLR
jgi:hypothetical protein